MNIEEKLLTLSNNKKYVVMETLDFEGKKYAYIMNRENYLDTMFIEFTFNGQYVVKEVEKELLKSKILPLFLEKFANR